MAKLYPPLIEGTLPAFTDTGVLTIPFAMNPSVSWNEVKKLIVKIKSVYDNETIMTLQTSDYDKDTQQAWFDFDTDDFIVGASYKVQMAYMDKNNEYGYYSTVGIIKYTTEPEVIIEGLEDSQLHSDFRAYIGQYSQKDGDITEKVYSYNFTVYDEDGAIIETSGELLHNHENDDKIYDSYDEYRLINSLEENKIYTIIYTVKTTNGLVVSSPKYRITQQSTVPPEIKADLVATMNSENGYVNLQLIGKKDDYGMEEVGTGTFLICRASSEDNYGNWFEVERFALFGETPSSHNWKDFTVQHGYKYIYSLQQYNKEYQIYSNRVLSNEVTAEFEHSFLYDGKRQLKIKFNPKVTSFKETLLEQKTNTLGGKYPFFFRNGILKYKEFPISGLISYHSDEEELFLTNDKLQLEDLSNLNREHTLKSNVHSADDDYFINILDANYSYKLQAEYRKREMLNSQENLISKKKDRTTNLTDYNIMAERIFKLNVLEFLNDGKPKLFRSPAEGNYIVRLMNSSLSPDDKLSRMIHTFSTTATQIDDFSYQKLNEYKIISTSDPDTKQLRWKTVNINELINTELKENGTTKDWISIGGENNLMSIQCLDMIPGDRIKILYAAPDNEERIIQIGTTGAYYIEFDKAPRGVFVSSRSRQGQITYSYYGTSLHHFDTYRYIKMDDIPIIQLFGKMTNNDTEIRKAFRLEDIKHKITKYYFLNFTKDFSEGSGTEYKFWIDGKEIDITETGNYQLIKPDYIPEIKLGNGICLDISIQRREIEYDIETIDSDVSEAKYIFEEQLNIVQNIKHYNIIKTKLIDITISNDKKYESFWDNEQYQQNLTNELKKLNDSYDIFIQVLEKVLKQKEVLAE